MDHIRNDSMRQMETQEVYIMDEKQQILEAMKKAGEPLNAGKIAELTGLDPRQQHLLFREKEVK